MLKEEWFKLSFEERLKLDRDGKAKFFVKENIISTSEHYSPSNKYKLIINVFKTGEKTWEYSNGEVFKNNSLIDIVNRNYRSFPFAFVENHTNGNDYLICGENYQGQTIIELNTGKRFDHIPGVTTNNSGGFCWSSIKASPKKDKLLVDGCYWASPYEYKLYDFTNPLSIPKEIKTIDIDGQMEPYGEIVDAEWIDDENCKMKIEYSWCVPKDKKFDLLTSEEKDVFFDMTDEEYNKNIIQKTQEVIVKL